MILRKAVLVLLLSVVSAMAYLPPHLQALLASRRRVQGGVMPVDPGTTSLLAWWQFESGAFTMDSSGIGRTLSGSGNPSNPDDATRGYVASYSQSAYHFRSGLTLNLYASAFTVAFWMSASSPQTGTVPMVFSTGGGGTGGVFLQLSESNAKTINWIFGQSSGTATAAVLATDDNVVGGGWIHVALTYDGSTSTGYRNGISLDSRTPTYVNSTAANLALGTRNNGSSTQGYVGRLDDVRIYNRVLSPEEILWLSQH